MVQEVRNWMGDCELRYGRPRHPQSQGLVEQANGSITDMLASMKASSDNPSQFKWSDSLPKVIFNLNTDYHSSIRTTALRAVFGMDHNAGGKKTTTNIEDDSLTFDSYDRLVKKESLTFDSFDRIVRRGQDYEDDEDDSFNDVVDEVSMEVDEIHSFNSTVEIPSFNLVQEEEVIVTRQTIVREVN